MAGGSVSAGPSDSLRSAVTALVPSAPVHWTQASGGFTPAERWIVGLSDGSSVFAKGAVDELTAGWLRAEHAAYTAFSAPFMPRLVGWRDGEAPVLVLEDLSRLPWPPPWADSRVRAVRDMLAEVAGTTPPEWLPSAASRFNPIDGWRAVAADPGPFLAVGVADEAWLNRALPALVAASDICRLDGAELLHFDVRSDNICFREGKALLVDWNLAAVGNSRIDVAFWLPSLADEGGPAPDTILADAGPEAALVSGYFAARAGLPQIPSAPRVREVQLRQLRRALPWACRAVGLPPP